MLAFRIPEDKLAESRIVNRSAEFGDTLFNQLFIRQLYDPASFKPVVLALPVLQVWEAVRDEQAIDLSIARLSQGLIPIDSDPVEWLDPESAAGEGMVEEPQPSPQMAPGRGPGA